MAGWCKCLSNETCSLDKHTSDDLTIRDIALEEVELTLSNPDRIAEGHSPLVIYQRRYNDKLLEVEMLLRVVIGETELEKVIIMLYKTSKLDKYHLRPGNGYAHHRPK